MEPPYITLKSPYGGFGLKTKSAQGARARFDGLFARCAVEVTLRELDLELVTPCPRAIAAALVAPDVLDTGGARIAIEPATAEALAARGHVLDEPSRAAWTSFGAPDRVSIRIPSRRIDTFLAATWRRDASAATAADAPFTAFLERWQALPYDDYVDGVTLVPRWSFRLTSTSGAIAEPPFPPSRVLAHLRRRHASAFLDLVFPYDAASPDFLADYAAVCAALGMRVPTSSLRLSAPVARATDGRRRLSKIRDIA